MAKNKWSKKDLEIFKNDILKKKDLAIQDLTKIKKRTDNLIDQGSSNSIYSSHMADAGSDHQEMENAYYMMQREDSFIKYLDKALSMIEDGSVKEYEDGYKKTLASLEQVDCGLCDSTGRRKEPPEHGAGTYMECNSCNGTGKVDDWAKSYPFSEDNVREFANFCANSGGFRIC